jgi:hypothetical protein
MGRDAHSSRRVPVDPDTTVQQQPIELWWGAQASTEVLLCAASISILTM